MASHRNRTLILCATHFECQLNNSRFRFKIIKPHQYFELIVVKLMFEWFHIEPKSKG